MTKQEEIRHVVWLYLSNELSMRAAADRLEKGAVQFAFLVAKVCKQIVMESIEEEKK